MYFLIRKFCIVIDFLYSNLDLTLLLLDKDKEYQLTKDMFAQAIEQLIEVDPFPQIIFHTFQKLHEHYSALNGFLSNVLVKVAQKRVWEQNQKDLWPQFLKCVKEIGNVAYVVSKSGLIQRFSEPTFQCQKFLHTGFRQS